METIGQRHTKRLKKIFSNKKCGAKRSGIKFTLKFEDMEFPDTCPVFGFSLSYYGKRTYHSPSFDRVNPSLGYVPGNVHIISDLANRMKSDATPEQLLQFAQWVINEANHDNTD